MSSIRAFFCATIPKVGEQAHLSDDEKRHVFRVLRAKRGDEIILLDGCGKTAYAKVADGEQIFVSSINIHSAPQISIRLFVSPPRHSGMDEILASSSEMAVSEIIPIICERSIAFSRNVEKWNRKIIESCKQSKNPFFPKIHETVSFEEAVKLQSGKISFYGDPYAKDTPEVSSFKGEISWFVGPEGGFSEKEISKMSEEGFKPLKLSPVIMRIETAATAGIAFLSNIR
ncbi:MAG TPA: RsmE family RNA methyltransferase [Victivallales bacterium]|mgnify:CR=1 FL=1|nr:RsmE family RNA methyltransferase [Victivallales bacterium]